MKARHLLVVDDDPSVIEIVQRAFANSDVVVDGASSGEEALNRMSRQLPHAILLDVRLPNMDGLEMCRLLRERGNETPIILASSYTSMDLTIEAMKEGAFDYLDKPLRASTLVPLLERAMDQSVQGNGEPAHVGEPDPDLISAEAAGRDRLVGKSPAILEVYKTIGRIARTRSTLLITGESGTGKELVARAIHEKGSLAGEPFQAINCAAIPESLLESELFGYDKGAFTGAVRDRPGRFELAGRGILFLDEVGELPASLQPKLLRAIEEREVDRLGGATRIPVHARLITASNRDLESAVTQGGFREDLFFRLAVVRIHIPPLRQRKEDIRILTDHFVARLGPELGRRIDRILPAAYDLLEEHDWPGNVRELRNVIERSLILGDGGRLLRPQDLPVLARPPRTAVPVSDLLELSRRHTSLAEIERLYITLALRETNGNLTRAADILGIHRTTLHRKIRGLDLTFHD